MQILAEIYLLNEKYRQKHPNIYKYACIELNPRISFDTWNRHTVKRN